VYERANQGVGLSERVCVRERACVVYERAHQGVGLSEGVCMRERVYWCMRGQIKVWVCQRACVCVKERVWCMRGHIKVWVCQRACVCVKECTGV